MMHGESFKIESKLPINFVILFFKTEIIIL
jgi:hypothetical protein